MADTILIVDDDSEFREELRSFLREYKVIEASSGQAALQVLKNANEIDAVMLDVMMPDSNGLDVLKEIKKIAPDVGIVILTGYSSKDTAIEALKSHADDYLEKPLDFTKAKETVENLLERKKGENPPPTLDAKGKVERIKRFAKRNISRNVGLKDASSLVFLSPKYISRVFKQTTGMGFARYKLEIKIRESKGLLKNTGFNINQIAEKIGYRNAESFTRIFKKCVHLSPTEYRRKVRAGGRRSVV